MLNEQRLDNLYWLEASQEEVMTEGANLDVRRIFVAHRKELKKGCKEVRKAYKRGDYDTAKKKIKDLKKTIDDMYKDISKLQTIAGLGSWVFGFLNANIMFIGRNIIGSIFAPIGTIVIGISVLAKRVEVIINDCKNEHRSFQFDEDTNGYINGIKVRLTEYKKILDKFERLMDSDATTLKSNKK